MSMRIRDLHEELGLLGTVQFSLLQSKGIMGNKHSLTRPTYVETLLKHPFFPENFGKSFDEIMSPDYCVEDAKANIRFTEFGRSNPETALLSERAQIQRQDICSLMEEAKEWIESEDISYRHQGNLEAFGKSFKDFFEKRDQSEHNWHRLVIALNAFFDEKLLPSYPKSPQLRVRCTAIVSILNADLAPEIDADCKKLMGEWDDLQWYFDNFCVGTTQVANVIEDLEAPQKTQVMASTVSGIPESHQNAAYAFDGNLMALHDGAIYVNQEKLDCQPTVGQVLYALLKKKAGYVSYIDFAHALYGEKATTPSKGRQAAIRKYLSTLRSLLNSIFPECGIESTKGKGWIFNPQVKQLATAK